MINEASMNISMTGNTGQEVAELMQLIRNAGLDDVSSVTSLDVIEPEPSCGCGGGHSIDSPCGEAVEEEYANSPDETYQDDSYMLQDLSGGLNRKKDQQALRAKDPAIQTENYALKFKKALEEKYLQELDIPMDQNQNSNMPNKGNDNFSSRMKTDGPPSLKDLPCPPGEGYSRESEQKLQKQLEVGFQDKKRPWQYAAFIAKEILKATDYCMPYAFMAADQLLAKIKKENGGEYPEKKGFLSGLFDNEHVTESKKQSLSESVRRDISIVNELDFGAFGDTLKKGWDSVKKTASDVGDYFTGEPLSDNPPSAAKPDVPQKKAFTAKADSPAMQGAKLKPKNFNFDTSKLTPQQKAEFNKLYKDAVKEIQTRQGPNGRIQYWHPSTGGEKAAISSKNVVTSRLMANLGAFMMNKYQQGGQQSQASSTAPVTKAPPAQSNDNTVNIFAQPGAAKSTDPTGKVDPRLARAAANPANASKTQANVTPVQQPANTDPTGKVDPRLARAAQQATNQKTSQANYFQQQRSGGAAPQATAQAAPQADAGQQRFASQMKKRRAAQQAAPKADAGQQRFASQMKKRRATV